MTIHLCFHGIGTIEKEREPGEAHYWVTEDAFHRMLDALADREDVELSFDDGNRSDADIALPALVDRGLDATFFALAGRLDDPLSLDSDDLQRLRGADMRIGSHGWGHVPWRGLTEVDAKQELIEARTVLEEASGARITQAALPLGRYDRRLLRRLRDAQYETVFTSDRFPARDTAWLRPRYSVTSTDTVESVDAIIGRSAGLGRGAGAGVDDAIRFGKSLIKRVR